MPYQIYDADADAWFVDDDLDWADDRDLARSFMSLDAAQAVARTYAEGLANVRVVPGDVNPVIAPLQTPARAIPPAARPDSAPYFLYQIGSGCWVDAAGFSDDYDSARVFSREDAESLAAAEPGLTLYGTFRGARRPVYGAGAPRKVVSVTSDIGRLIAVDADGIMWVLERCADEWTLLPQLPRMLINQPGA